MHVEEYLSVSSLNLTIFINFPRYKIACIADAMLTYRAVFFGLYAYD